jgi:hypothetical protein
VIRRAVATGALAALGILAASPARAEDRSLVRRMRFAERGHNLVITTSFPEIFDRVAIEKLSSGLATRIAVRLYVFHRRQTERPVSLVLFESEVVYDLWDEVYVVRTRGPLGEKQVRLRSRQQAVRALTELTRTPVAPLVRIGLGPHYFAAMVVELNPVSPELLAEMRRWLSRPAGEASVESSSSFFGSFVSVFVNPKLDRADRVLRIRSQPFYRAPR